MKTYARFGLISFALLFVSVLSAQTAKAADESTELVANPVIQGEVFNPDGSPYTGTGMYVYFVAEGQTTNSYNYEWFGISTKLVNGHTIYTSADKPAYQKIKKIRYQAYLGESTSVGIVDTATPKTYLLPKTQIVDLQNQQQTTTLNFNLVTPTKFLHGRVTDQNGKPLSAVQGGGVNDNLFFVYGITRVSGASRSTEPYDQYWTRTDTSGRFALAVGDGGVYDTGANTNDRDHFSYWSGNGQQITFRNDSTVEDIEVNFVIQRVGTSKIVGRILDKQGRPAKNYPSIGAYSTSAPFAGNYAIASADGKFSIALSAGQYAVSITSIADRTKSPITYIQYPSVTVDVTDGQTIDLGDIAPARTYEVDPKSTITPKLIEIAQTELALDQAPGKKQAAYVEGFGSKKYFDTVNSTGVVWGNGKVSLNTISGQSLGLVRSLATSSPTLQQGVVVSKPVTPRGLQVTTVTLTDTRSASAGAGVSFSITADGRTWYDVVPGKAFTLPAGVSTKNGLRWRASLQRPSTTDTLELKNVRLSYTYTPSSVTPRIVKIATTRKSSTTTVAISGAKLSKNAAVYLGGTKVSGITQTPKGSLIFTVSRRDFGKSGYAVTVINPDLRVATGPSIDLRTTSVKRK